MKNTSTRPVKTPYIAFLLGILIIGLGHIYIGRWKKGLAWMGVAFGIGLFAALLGSTLTFALIAGILVEIASLINLYRIMKKQDDDNEASAQRSSNLGDGW